MSAQAVIIPSHLYLECQQHQQHQQHQPHQTPHLAHGRMWRPQRKTRNSHCPSQLRQLHQLHQPYPRCFLCPNRPCASHIGRPLYKPRQLHNNDTVLYQGQYAPQRVRLWVKARTVALSNRRYTVLEILHTPLAFRPHPQSLEAALGSSCGKTKTRIELGP